MGMIRQRLLRVLLAEIELPGWMPGWVKDHAAIKGSDKEKVIGDKYFPFDNFEVKVELQNIASQEQREAATKLYNKIYADICTARDTTLHATFVDILDPAIYLKKVNKGQLVEYLNSFSMFIDKIYYASRQYKRNHFVMDEVISSKFPKKPYKDIDYKVVNINSGTTCFKALDMAYQLLRDIGLPTPKSITETEEFKIYSTSLQKRDDFDLYVVFSKDPIDILGMSSRSDGWTSCQKLTEDTGYNCRAIDAALSKSIGIIYLTDKSKTERGEKMIARSLVFAVSLGDIGDWKKKMLLIGPIYSSFSKDIADQIQESFVKALKEKSGLIVKPVKKGDFLKNLILEKDMEHEQGPYLDFDIGEKKTFKKEKKLSKRTIVDRIFVNSSVKSKKILSNFHGWVHNECEKVGIDWDTEKKIQDIIDNVFFSCCDFIIENIESRISTKSEIAERFSNMINSRFNREKEYMINSISRRSRFYLDLEKILKKDKAYLSGVMGNRAIKDQILSFLHTRVRQMVMSSSYYGELIDLLYNAQVLCEKIFNERLKKS